MRKVDENVKPSIDDSEELRKYIEIVLKDGDEVLIEATPISSRSLAIIDYKIHKEGKKTYFKIIIANDRFKKEKPVDDMDNILFRTLKTIFEHHVKDTIWKYQQGLAKVYPLTKNTLHQLWSDVRLQKIKLKEQVDSLEQNLSKQLKEKEFLLQIFIVFKSESKEKEDKYMENKIDLEKKIKELDNILFKVGQSAQTVYMLTKPQAFYDNIHKQALGYHNPFHLKKAQRIKPTLYDGIVMYDKHIVMHVIDDEETLILEEESRSRIKPSDALPVKIKAPKELPKISLVNESLKNLKFHFAKFDNVVKIRTTPNARTEEQFDSIKKTRVRAKEQSDSLIDKLNLKSVENEDLKAQIQDKASGSSGGADFELEVPDEPTGDSEDESDDFNDEDNDGGNDNDNGNDDDGEEEQDKEYVHTLEKDKSNDEEKMYEEENDDIAKELYGDLNITHGLRDTDMTNVEQGGEDQQNASHEYWFKQEEDAGHVTLTTVHDKTEGTMQSSSVSSNFTSKLLNLDNTGLDANEIASLMNTSTVPAPPPPVNPSSHLTIIPQQQTPDSTTTTTNLIVSLPKIPNFASLFQFDQRVFALEIKLKEEVNVAVWLKSNKLREEAQAENQEFLNQVDSTRKAIIKEQVKAQVSKIMPQIEKGRDDQDKDKDPSVGSYRGTKQRKLSKDVEPLKVYAKQRSQYFEAADTEMQYDQGNEFGLPDDQPDDETAPKNNWFKKPKKPPTPDHPWNKRKSIDSRPPQIWIRPTFNLLKGTCKSFTELEYHFEECYKAVNDKLDWNNLKGHAYLFDLSKPLPLIEVRVQKKLSNLDVDDRYDLETIKSNISKLAPYTAYKNPQEIIYQDKYKRNRLMRSDELYKFCDGTLSSIRTVLHDIASSLEIDHLPKRHWSNLEKKRSRIMIKAIDKLLFERSQNRRDLPRDIPLDSVKVLRRRVFSSDLDGRPIRGKDVRLLIESDVFKKLDDNDAVSLCCDYNKAKDPILFRRRVFSSDLDGRPIRGKDVRLLIESDVFKKLDDNDAVSLCCVGILQLVLLGVEDRRLVSNWILRLANDRVSWDNYPWGSYVWPTLYKHLRDANVKCWQPLYDSDPTNETDMKSYSIKGFAWAFKTWILESFRAAMDDYYTRYRHHPRIGQLPVERLVPDETEARLRWWVSSRAYFDGHSFEDEHIPRHLNRNNYVKVPSEMYREFEEQRRRYQQMKKKNDDMYEKRTRFMEDMRRVPEANTTPIIADQHFGVSDISGFQSYQGVPSAFHTSANNSSFFNMATPSNLQTPNQSNWLSPSNWQTPNPSYLGTPNSQPTIPSQPENNRFMILTNPHNIGTLDGSVCPFPSWNDVTWVYMPINAEGVHWVTGAINLTDSIFYVFDSMESESRMLMLEQQVNNWTPVINSILETRGYFNGTGRQP
nr:phospholipase-like protein [Tanacetum cinerariifolium]